MSWADVTGYGQASNIDIILDRFVSFAPAMQNRLIRGLAENARALGVAVWQVTVWARAVPDELSWNELAPARDAICSSEILMVPNWDAWPVQTRKSAVWKWNCSHQGLLFISLAKFGENYTHMYNSRWQICSSVPLVHTHAPDALMFPDEPPNTPPTPNTDCSSRSRPFFSNKKERGS